MKWASIMKSITWIFAKNLATINVDIFISFFTELCQVIVESISSGKCSDLEHPPPVSSLKILVQKVT